MVIFDDLEAEQDRLQGILDGLDEALWASPSAATGWTVADVVLHLAQTEEAVLASATGATLGVRPASGATLDEVMDQLIQAERAAPARVFGRWRTARVAAVAALRAADPQRPLPWVEVPLKPATLATTRLAEHWAHGLDITGPLGIGFPDTARLRHIAWLAHRSLSYAFALAGEPPHEVFCELTAPDGTTRWQYGPPRADSAITGPAGPFCRVAVPAGYLAAAGHLAGRLRGAARPGHVHARGRDHLQPAAGRHHRHPGAWRRGRHGSLERSAPVPAASPVLPSRGRLRPCSDSADSAGTNACQFGPAEGAGCRTSAPRTTVE